VLADDTLLPPSALSRTRAHGLINHGGITAPEWLRATHNRDMPPASRENLREPPPSQRRRRGLWRGVPDFHHVFAVTDASIMVIEWLTWHQEHSYSRKYVHYDMKILTLVTPDGHCIYLSRVYRGAMHDQVIVDRSEVAAFFTHQDDRDLVQHKRIMGDSGYIRITRTCPGAMSPPKRPRGRDMTKKQNPDREPLRPSTEDTWIRSILWSGRWSR
jgi:hypothetical protein